MVGHTVGHLARFPVVMIKDFRVALSCPAIMDDHVFPAAFFNASGVDALLHLAGNVAIFRSTPPATGRWHYLEFFVTGFLNGDGCLRHRFGRQKWFGSRSRCRGGRRRSPRGGRRGDPWFWLGSFLRFRSYPGCGLGFRSFLGSFAGDNTTRFGSWFRRLFWSGIGSGSWARGRARFRGWRRWGIGRESPHLLARFKKFLSFFEGFIRDLTPGKCPAQKKKQEDE